MKFIVIIIWAALFFGAAQMNAQRIVGNQTGNATFDNRITSIDVINCDQQLVAYTVGLGTPSDIVYAPDGYLYGIIGFFFDVLAKLDPLTGEIVEQWDMPTDDVTDGPFSGGGLAINSKGEIYIGLGRGHLLKFEIETEIFDYIGQFEYLYNNFFNFAAITFYRDRLFLADQRTKIFAELFPETLTYDSLMTVPYIHQGLTVLEEECGKPVFISSAERRLIAIYPDLGTYEILCHRTGPDDRTFWGLTHEKEHLGFFNCRDTIDLNSTEAGFDHYYLAECGVGRAFVAHDSVRVYGEFPMDSIGIAVVEDPDLGSGTIEAGNVGGITVTGSGTAEVLAYGMVDFPDWEAWLRTVEYVSTSPDPTPGLRRIAVVGYFNEGETTDTAWFELEIQRPEFSAGTGTSINNCPTAGELWLFDFLTGADEGGRWEPDLPDGMVQLLPSSSGTYYYIIDHPDCGSDTAVMELFIWPGPDVGIGGDLIICEGSTATLSVTGDLSDAVSFLWSNGSTAGSIEVDEEGDYWLRMVYGEDCIWSDTVSITIQDLLLLDQSESICPGSSFEWYGLQIEEAGEYETTLSGQHGNCDTLVLLTVTEVDYESAETTIGICPGESYEFQGETMTEEGQYEFILPGLIGCDTLLRINLEWEAIPQKTEVVTLCPGKSYEFQGETLTEEGQYEFILPGLIGCDTLLRINLEWEEIPQKTEVVTLCPGKSYEFQGETLTEEGQYDFILPGLIGCDTLLRINLEWEAIPQKTEVVTLCPGESIEVLGEQITNEGTYDFILPGASSNCDTLYSLEVHSAILPWVTITGPDRVCEGQTIVLRAEPMDELFDIWWSTGQEGGAVEVDRPGWYSFEASSPDHCELYAEKLISDCPSRRIYIPNAFSPNDDGVNDRWTIYPAAETQLVEVSIYDRWGSRVFEQSAPTISWDGTFRGEKLPAGVYLFRLRVVFPDGLVEVMEGEVVLVR